MTEPSKPLIGLTWEPKIPSFGSNKSRNSSSSKEPQTTSLYKSDAQLVDGLFLPPNDPRKLNKLLRKQVKDTAGKNWFDMPAQTITTELKKDLQLLKLRSALDPKRHYKNGGTKSKALPKYFQVGTVIESSMEFYSGRLTKKERKATLADELLSDINLRAYRKRKVREIEETERSKRQIDRRMSRNGKIRKIRDIGSRVRKEGTDSMSHQIRQVNSIIYIGFWKRR